MTYFYSRCVSPLPVLSILRLSFSHWSLVGLHIKRSSTYCITVLWTSRRCKSLARTFHVSLWQSCIRILLPSVSKSKEISWFWMYWYTEKCWTQVYYCVPLFVWCDIWEQSMWGFQCQQWSLLLLDNAPICNLLNVAFVLEKWVCCRDFLCVVSSGNLTHRPSWVHIIFAFNGLEMSLPIFPVG